MTQKFSFEYLAFFFILSMVTFLYLLGHSYNFQPSTSPIAQAILADLFLTMPIGYFLIIRNTKIPNFTTVYVLLFALLISGFILPEDQQALLKKFKFFIIPAVELGILSMLIHKVWKLRKSYHDNQIDGIDFYDNLSSATQEIFPKRLAGLLTTEISVFYYLFKSAVNRSPNAEAFSYNKKSGITMVIGVILCLVVIETFVVHLLLERWNITVAWVLSFLSLYAGFQILSILRSMKHRPIIINTKTKELRLRYGHAAQCTFPIEIIKRIEKTRKINKKAGLILLTPFDLLETTNLIIHLKEEHSLLKIYGMEKSFTSIALHIDEVDRFILKLEELMK